MKSSRVTLTGAALASILIGAGPLFAFEAPAAPPSPGVAAFLAQLAGAATGSPPPANPFAPGAAAPPSWRPAQRPPLAPPAPGKWWKSSEVAQELQLTDAQVAQIEQSFLDHRLRLIDLRADLEKQEALLQPLLDVDRPDNAKVAAQIDQVVAARGRLEKTQTMMLLAVRGVLTVEQWRRLQAIQDREARPPDRPLPNWGPFRPPRAGG